VSVAIFWGLGTFAIAGGVLCITRRNAVASALCLVMTLFALAGMFAMLDAHFIAVMEVIVYAGAIMVLFLFVIMLLNAGRPGAPTDIKVTSGKVTAGVFGLVLAIELFVIRRAVPAESAPGLLAPLTEERGAVGVIAEPLFQTYLVPFEITSLLLLAAVVGAVVLAKRRI
jgi:NADH-quinone oxidoreductase subunit J